MSTQRHHERDAKQRFHEAMQAFGRGDHAAAARTFGQIAGGGTLYAMLARYYAAEAYLRAGLLLLGRGDPEGAAREFSGAQQYDPDHGDLPCYLACCFAQLRRYHPARRCSAHETRLKPGHSDPRIRLALCQWLDGQQEAALHTLRSGIESLPQQAPWHFQLGLLMAAREQYDGAIAALERAVELDPRCTDAHVHLGLCFGALEQPERAVIHLNRAQQQRPHDARIALLLSMAVKAGRGDEAIPALRPATPAAPPALELCDLEQLACLVEQEPDVIEAFVSNLGAGACTDLLGTLQGAVRRALTRDPHRAELHHHQARLYRRAGQLEPAIEACRQAARLAPQSAAALVTLGELHLEAGRPQDAASCLEQVLAMGCQYADVHYRLGCIYRDRGESGSARQAFVRALGINTRYAAARQALDSMAA